MEAVAPLLEVNPTEPQVLLPAPVPTHAPFPAAKGKRWRDSALIHFTLLLTITALGGALRFMYLDRPAIWGDEALTFGRISGTFYELMDRLQGAGFAPAHYELYWWIGQHTILTPFMMRLVPAITGTLMVPAMYWLAAQLIGRRAALLTALLTATNAFLLNYSRDAKMYSPFWLFAALNVASLLWWLRVRSPLSWCAWITSGTAMVGFDALGWITVAIELVMVISTREGNWISLVRLVPLLVFASIDWCLTLGSVVFFVLIRTHALGGRQRLIAVTVILIAILRGVGLAAGWWLARRRTIGEGSRDINVETTPESEAIESGDTPVALESPRLASPIERFLRWPTERSVARPWIANRVAKFRWPPIVLFVFGLLIMLAGPFGYYYDFNRFLERVDDRGWNGTGIEWVEGYNAGRSGASLVGFTASAFLTSWEWPRPIDQTSVAPRTLRLLMAATLGIAAVLALGLLPWPWAKRLRPFPTLGGWRSAMWLILWLIMPPYAFYCVSVKNHWGPQSWLEAPNPLSLPFPLAILDSTALMFVTFIHSLVVAIKQVSPWIGVSSGMLAAGWFWAAGDNWRERIFRALQFLAIAFITLLAIESFYLLYPRIDVILSAHSAGWRQHGSVWMPRYIAVILPAVLIIATALLWRLPTRPLRWGAILLVVVVNLSVHGARVFAGTEPPSALLAHDILDSQNADDGDRSLRAYFESSLQGGAVEPGTVGLRSTMMRYYITILSPRTSPSIHEWTPPNEIFESQMRYRVLPGRGAWMSFSGFVINDVRSSPKLRSFITWERLEPGELDLTDKPLDALAPDWRLASEEIFAVRDHWRWKETCTLRRRVYVRTAQRPH